MTKKLTLPTTTKSAAALPAFEKAPRENSTGPRARAIQEARRRPRVAEPAAATTIASARPPAAPRSRTPTKPVPGGSNNAKVGHRSASSPVTRRVPEPIASSPKSTRPPTPAPTPERPRVAATPRTQGPPDDGKIRLSKLMSEQGLCSRREADEWIAKGWVTVDDVVIDELGTRILPTQKIAVTPAATKEQQTRVTILLNKPVGYVSGQAEDGHLPASVLFVGENRWENDLTPNRFHPMQAKGLAPAGRLDIDSVGLIVFTQDGRVAKQLIGDNSEVEKEYLVRVEGTLSEADMKLLHHGLELDGQPLRPAKVSWQNEDQLRFVLREGKKRQIRRMCEMVGLTVVGLKRVRIGKINLGDLPAGKWRYLGQFETFA